MTKPFRLSVMMTTHQRPELTQAVMEWWEGLHVPGVHKFGVAVGDFALLRPGLASPTWLCYAHANEPLGRKHNAALRHCRADKPDGVMVIGSDDIVEPKLLSRSVSAIEKGALWTQPKNLYLWHPESGRVSTPDVPYITGAGRVYSRRLLNVLDWKLWDDSATAKLDGNALDTIRRCVMSRKILVGKMGRGMHITCGAEEIDGAVLDIKTDVNMWDYDEAAGITQARDVDPAILETFEIERFTYRLATAED